MQKVQENNKKLTGWLLHNQHQETQNQVVRQTKIYTRKKQEKSKIQKEVCICCWRSLKVGDQPVLLLGDGTVCTKKSNSGVCKIILNQEILLL